MHEKTIETLKALSAEIRANPEAVSSQETSAAQGIMQAAVDLELADTSRAKAAKAAAEAKAKAEAKPE